MLAIISKLVACSAANETAPLPLPRLMNHCRREGGESVRARVGRGLEQNGKLTAAVVEIKPVNIVAWEETCS